MDSFLFHVLSSFSDPFSNFPEIRSLLLLDAFLHKKDHSKGGNLRLRWRLKFL